MEETHKNHWSPIPSPAQDMPKSHTLCPRVLSKYFLSSVRLVLWSPAWGSLWFRKVRLMFAINVPSNLYLEKQMRKIMSDFHWCPAPAYFTTFRIWLLPWAASPCIQQRSLQSEHVQVEAATTTKKEPLHLQHWQLSSVCCFHLILQKEEQKANGQWKNKFQCQKINFFLNPWPVSWPSYPFIRNKTKTRTPPHIWQEARIPVIKKHCIWSAH